MRLNIIINSQAHKLLSVASVLSFNMMVLSCGGDDNPAGDEPIITEIRVSSDTSKLLMGEKTIFTLEAFDTEGNEIENPDIQWHTSNENIAVISNNGIFSTHDIGIATVFASGDEIESNRVSIEVTNLGDGIVATGAIIPYEIVYLDDLTFFKQREEGAPIVFHYYLTSDTYPIRVRVRFNLVMSIPHIGLSNHEFFWFDTDFFTLEAGLYIPSYDIIHDPGPFFDLDGNEIDSIGLVYDYDEDFDHGDIVEKGILPAGTYVITIDVEEINAGTIFYSFDNPMDWIIEDVSSISLLNPGGPDDEQREIFNIFPTFMWSTTGCTNALRVSEYIESEHFTPKDALDAGAVLPFPNDGGYYDLGENTTFIYSTGKSLETNKTYVWRVRKTCNTSSGDAEVFSEIWAFTIR